MNQNKTWKKKILTGLLFIASLFITTVVFVFTGQNPQMAIIPVIISGLLMLVSAYLFLNAIFEEKVDELNKLKEEAQKELEEDIFRQEMKEYIESVDRTQKAVFSVMKRREEATEGQIARLEKAIERMAEQQMSDHKALVKYNKENARQMAINERETLEHIKNEILKELKDGKNKETELLQSVLEKGITVGAVSAEAVSAKVTEDLPEEESDFVLPELMVPEMDMTEDVIPDFAMPEMEEPELAIPEMEELEFVMPEIEEPEFEIPELILPELPEVETEPAPTAAEDTSEDALGALSGVDLSDPNATLTPEDIAKLFAAAGN